MHSVIENLMSFRVKADPLHSENPVSPRSKERINSACY